MDNLMSVTVLYRGNHLLKEAASFIFAHLHQLKTYITRTPALPLETI